MRYFEWIGGVLQGDFGSSFSSRVGYRRTVTDIIAPRLYNTLFLAGMAAAHRRAAGAGLGVLAALYRNSWFDRMVNAVTLTTISFPEFFVAYILMLLAGGQVPRSSTRSPTSTRTCRLLRPTATRIALPALTLTLVIVAHMMRMTRAAIINLLASPYIEMAAAQGRAAQQDHPQARAAQCLGADRQRHRLQPRLSGRRRRRRRGGVRLSRHRPGDGRCGVERATCRSCRPAR